MAYLINQTKYISPIEISDDPVVCQDFAGYSCIEASKCEISGCFSKDAIDTRSGWSNFELLPINSKDRGFILKAIEVQLLM